MFNQLVTLPTHIDGGEFSDPKVSEDNILRIEHEFVEPEMVNIATSENISHLQAFWTKPTFASQENPRRMLKSRHSPTTTATMTA